MTPEIEKAIKVIGLADERWPALPELETLYASIFPVNNVRLTEEEFTEEMIADYSGKIASSCVTYSGVLFYFGYVTQVELKRFLDLLWKCAGFDPIEIDQTCYPVYDVDVVKQNANTYARYSIQFEKETLVHIYGTPGSVDECGQPTSWMTVAVAAGRNMGLLKMSGVIERNLREWRG